MPSRSLPEDIESLQRLVVEQRAALEAARSTLLSRDVEIEKLKIELARLKRMQFGRSSEQLDQTIVQLELSLEELEASAAENSSHHGGRAGGGKSQACPPCAAGEPAA